MLLVYSVIWGKEWYNLLFYNSKMAAINFINGHNFLSNTVRIMILVSIYRFSGMDNPMKYILICLDGFV